MSKIAIVGAGRLGTALAKLLVLTSDHEIALIDNDEAALTRAFTRCSKIIRPEHRVAFSPEIPVETFTAYTTDQLEATLRASAPELVVCSAVAEVTYAVAEIANRLGCHYLDFNTDPNVAQSIRHLSVARHTFVPQTGLAPGLLTYVALGLVAQLEEAPASLQLRVGVMPQVAFSPSQYALTSRVGDLVESYTYPYSIKTQGNEEVVAPLDGYETLLLNGAPYEAFYASGSLVDLECFDKIPSVDFKAVRPVGHLDYLQKLLSKVDSDDAIPLFKQTFNTTRDDYVVFIAHATDVAGQSISSGLIFYPSLDLDISADELCNAGTACGIIELIFAEKLEAGILSANQIVADDLFQTQGVQLIFYQSE
jgi:saccharopine dehydrogenase-like NADP-dependent oxidoreductase